MTNEELAGLKDAITTYLATIKPQPSYPNDSFQCPECHNHYEFHYDGAAWVFQLVQG
jgi:hypothetical protein